MGSVTTRLSIMMFLQFFIWGAWAPTLGACFSANGIAEAIANAYSAGPIAAIIAPLFLGLIADRFFSSQKVFGSMMLLSAVFMYLAIGYAEAGNTQMIGYMFLGHMLCYMPTLGLGNSIAFANVDDPNKFPAIRVWGTIGWIAAGLIVGASGWSTSINILWISVFAAIASGIYSFTLPHTPPPAKGTPLDIGSLLMKDAFAMLTKLPFLVFIVCSTLLCVPLAYYYLYTSNLLTNAGFEQASSVMTLGQMSEIFFMLLIPFFFRMLGVKWMLLIGMSAWIVRYLLFAFGAPDQVTWMLLAGLIVHGVCYDFFFVTGFMYADKRADEKIRGQVQSMLVFFTQGIGMFFGFSFADQQKQNTMKSEEALSQAFASAREAQDIGYFEKLSQMFSQSIPEGIDSALLSETMNQWKEFWLLPAGMAAAVMVLFAVAFWDRVEVADPEAIDPETSNQA